MFGGNFSLWKFDIGNVGTGTGTVPHCTDMMSLSNRMVCYETTKSVPVLAPVFGTVQVIKNNGTSKFARYHWQSRMDSIVQESKYFFIRNLMVRTYGAGTGTSSISTKVNAILENYQKVFPLVLYEVRK